MRHIFLISLVLSGMAPAQTAASQTPARTVSSPQRIAGAVNIIAKTLNEAQPKDCPSELLGVGSPFKKCFVVGGDIQKIKRNLAPINKYFYGAWQKKNGTEYNWLRVGGGYVYIRLQKNPENGPPNLIYLDSENRPSTVK